MLVFSIVIIIYLAADVEACFHRCPEYHYKNFGNRRFISHLSDSSKLHDLALVGTRYSATYNTDIPRYKTQDLNIMKQLNYGVRVLDCGLRPTSNRFAMHKYSKFLNLMFGDVLAKADTFLAANPREFIIILVRQEHYAASDVTKTNCDILQFYRHTYQGKRIVSDWSLDDTIGKHRGKILLAGLDSTFSNCTLDFITKCRVQNTKTSIESSSRIEDKWIEIKKLHDESFRNNSGSCFVNFLADYTDTNTMRMAIKGYSTSRNGCEAPLNVRMAKHFDNPHRALVIVMADFVTQELIDCILQSNFPSSEIIFLIEKSFQAPKGRPVFIKRKYQIILNYF